MKTPTPQRHVKLLALRELPPQEKAAALGNPDGFQSVVEQGRLFSGAHFAFSPEWGSLGALPVITGKYGDYGTPMQGTSTGNSAELIAYYWEHLRDPAWVPVSKGGGYARWRGLNSYVLKWGTDGEYIRATKGSALRNTKYFDRTSIVYSDTGTSGFNARLLEPGQLFVASGPGIRDVAGCSYAHLALLNSRLFSYYLRCLSPKLTVAAGYIARVPVPDRLLDLPEMEALGRACYARKTAFLQMRPNNLEWMPPAIRAASIGAYALQLFLAEMQDELAKLTCEAQIDRILLRAYALGPAETKKLDMAVGLPAAALKGTLPAGLDSEMARRWMPTAKSPGPGWTSVPWAAMGCWNGSPGRKAFPPRTSSLCSAKIRTPFANAGQNTPTWFCTTSSWRPWGSGGARCPGAFHAAKTILRNVPLPQPGMGHRGGLDRRPVQFGPHQIVLLPPLLPVRGRDI